MNANKQAKHNEVKEMSEKISAAKGLVIAEYKGLTVKELQSLRKDLKAQGVEAKVYKNRLFKIAAKEAGLSELDSALTGPNLYVFGMEDDISPAKVLATFAKENEALKMKAGTYEGKVIDSAELAEIAILPTYEEALTILAMSLLSPVQQIGVGLNMLITEGKLDGSAEEATKPIEEPVKVDAEESNEEATVKVESTEATKEESPVAETKVEASTEAPKEEAA